MFDELDILDSFSEAPVPWLTCDNIELTMVDSDLLSDKHIELF